MASSRSYEEAHEDYKRVMGDELGSAYHLLWNECALLHMHWEEYLELFANEPRNFDIMNETAPGFFRSIQDLYWESVLLGLCRFADNRTAAGKRTLSLDTLLSLPKTQAVPNIAGLVAYAKNQAQFAKDWRNRRIAHADLLHSLDGKVAPLASASRAHVRAALSAVVDVLNAVEMHFTGSSLGFIGTGFNFGGTHLLNQLRAASRLQKEHLDRTTRGVFIAGDDDWHKWRGTLG